MFVDTLFHAHKPRESLQPPDLSWLRYYQQDARVAVSECHGRARGALVVIPTGAGKSAVAGAIAWDHRVRSSRVLVLTPTITLTLQMYEAMRKLGLTCTIEQADNHAVRPLPAVTVACVATMRGKRLEGFARDDFGLIIVDECFPAGTTVDGRPIESIEPGDMVWSVDHDTGLPKKSRVAAVRTASSGFFTTIHYNGRSMRCTSTHPVFVRGRGYVEAKRVACGDMLCVCVDIPSGAGVDDSSDMLEALPIQPCVGQENGYLCRQAEAGSSSRCDGIASVLDVRSGVPGAQQNQRTHMLEGVSVCEMRGWTWPVQSRVCGRQDARDEPNAHAWREEPHGGDSEDYRAQATCSRREWPRAYGSGVGVDGCCSRIVGDAVCYSNETAEGVGVSNLVQSGFGTAGYQACGGSRRKQPRTSVEDGARQEKRRALVWVRVDRVESKEQGSPTTVYNLEVEGSHTYFANGALVHNCHRSIAGQYDSIFRHFAGAKLLGLTATPDRTDGVSLANVFTELAYEMTMLRAIEEGFLAPLRFRTVATDFDPKALRTLAGEIDAGSVAKEITRSGLLHEAANALKELSDGERTLAFLPTVASSKAFVAELLAAGVPACHIDGTTPSSMREQAFQFMREGSIRVLSNVNCLTEGFDLPAVSVVALLNPSKSRSRVCQMVGRATRLSPGKESALILDFCPGRLKRGRLASPADALAGKMLDDAVYDHMPTDGNLADAIEEAKQTAADVQQRKDEAEARARIRAEREQEMRRLATKREFTYESTDHDMRSMLSDAPDVQSTQSKRVKPPQMDYSDELNETRRRRGLCSVKQGNLLAKHGLNPDLGWRDAKAAIDAIVAAKWKCPPEIRAKFAWRPA